MVRVEGVHNFQSLHSQDRAERGVKLIQEYIASAHSEGDLQDLLLVVDEQKTKLFSSNTCQ